MIEPTWLTGDTQIEKAHNLLSRFHSSCTGHLEELDIWFSVSTRLTKDDEEFKRMHQVFNNLCSNWRLAGSLHKQITGVKTIDGGSADEALIKRGFLWQN